MDCLTKVFSKKVLTPINGWGLYPYKVSRFLLENTFIAHIREQGKNVFIRSDTSEYLLYNFNLNLGDTLPPSYNNFFENITISSIDSININGVFLRKFELSGEAHLF